MSTLEGQRPVSEPMKHISSVNRGSAINDDLNELRHKPIGTQQSLNEISYIEAVDYVQRVKNANNGNPRQIVRTLLPLWSKLDKLVVAQCCVVACTQDFGWISSLDAFRIAELLRDSYIVFPEVSKVASQRDIVDTILEEQQDVPLYALVLAHRLDPNHVGAIRALVLELYQRGHIEQAQALLDQLPRDNDRDVLISRILGPHEGGGTTGALVAQSLIDRLLNLHSLAGLRLGKALTNGFSKDAQSIESVSFASSVAKLRELTRPSEQYFHGPFEKRDDNSTHLIDLFARVGKICTTKIPRNPRRPHYQPEVLQGRPSGVVSWFNYLLGEAGTVSIPLSIVRADERDRQADGSIVGPSQAGGEAFIYGPYITLEPGLYRVTFSGEVTSPTILTLMATSKYGTDVHARSIFVADKHESSKIAEIIFDLKTTTSACEFVMLVRPGSDRIVIRSVELARISLTAN